MLGLDTNQAIEAIEELLRKVKSGEATLCSCDFTLDALNGSSVQSLPRIKLEVEFETMMLQPPATDETGAPLRLVDGQWQPTADDDEEFTMGEDGLPAPDEYAWSTNEFVQQQTMAVVRGGRKQRPSFDSRSPYLNINSVDEFARRTLLRKRATVPVKAPKPKKQPFGSRDLDID